MDNLTHSLIGLAAANTGLKRRIGPGVTAALLLSSNITDIDVLWGLVHEGESFLYRRMLTHSIAGLPVLAALTALLLKMFYRNQSWLKLFGLSLLGIFLHIFFDLLNSYGVVLLYPFSRARYELGWVFIIDLALWLILIFPHAVTQTRFARPARERIFRWTLGATAVYVGICGLGRLRAEQMTRQWTSANVARANAISVFPEALGPHRFRAAVKEPGVYHVVLCNVLLGEARLVRDVETLEGDPELILVRATERARKIEWFFKAPVWTRARQENGETLWQVSDLRFRSEVIPRMHPFVYRIENREKPQTPEKN